MDKIYETVKGIGRKYVGPAVLGAALVFGGCEKEAASQDMQSIKAIAKDYERDKGKELEGVNQRWNNKIATLERTIEESGKCEGLLMKGIEDGYLSEIEQKKILLDYNQMVNEGLGKEGSFLSFPSREKRIYELLGKNVMNTDWGVPELEKELRKRGHDVEVEKIDTFADASYIGSGILGCIGILYVCGRLSYGRRKLVESGE